MNTEAIKEVLEGYANTFDGVSAVELVNFAAAELTAMQARIEKVCKWELFDDEEWETSCNETIYMEGLPDEDWKFCPFCGGKIKANK